MTIGSGANKFDRSHNYFVTMVLLMIGFWLFQMALHGGQASFYKYYYSNIENL